MIRGELEIGSVEDIDLADWHNNRDTFSGSYASIIQRYRSIAPDSYFFLMTLANSGTVNVRTSFEEEHRALLYGLSEMFPNVFVLDIRRYGPVYDDQFKRKFWLGSHMNPMGYIFTSQMVMTYIDHIIRSDMHRFAQTGFINTPWKNTVDL